MREQWRNFPAAATLNLCGLFHFFDFCAFFTVLIPGKTPLMILSNATLFPGAILPLHIFEPRYGRMLSDVLESHRMFAIAMRRPGTRREVPMPVACLGVVRVCVGVPDGTSNLLRNPLERQVVLESLDIKTRPMNVSHFLSMEIERNNMGPEGYS